MQGPVDRGMLEESKEIIQFIFSNLQPNITPDKYVILKDFDTKVGYTRHSMLIKFKELTTKKDLMGKCKELKNKEDGDPMKYVYINHDQPPLTKKENDRLRKKFRDLRDANSNTGTKVELKAGKVFVADEIVDEFSLSNQIF